MLACRRVRLASKQQLLIPFAHISRAGLTTALELLKDVSEKHPGVSYADVFQLASVTAIELAGGPKIPLRFGRKDAATEEDCVPEGRLPGARLLCEPLL